MIKFILMVLFMNFMVMMNGITMFYYNLSYVISLMLVFVYMSKDVEWFNLSMSWGCGYFSIVLVVLSSWIIGLMFMCLSFEEGKFKLYVFVNMLMLMFLFFLSMDLILFYLFFEVSLIPTFFLVIYWGYNPERVGAAYYMIMYMLLISFPLLVYIFDIYMYGGTLKFALMAKVMSEYEFTFWGFLMIYMAFFIKMPMYMFHIWLPKAHVEAPVYGSMVLAGVLLKMGGYGLVRLVEVFYSASINYVYVIVSIGMVGALASSLACLTQVDMKSLVAYSSVVHMNLMLGSMMTLNKVGVAGAYIMMVSHGLSSSGLFYMVNLFYERSGSRLLIMNKGVVGMLPSVITWWFLFCVVNFSFPLSLSFVGEVMMLMVILNWAGGLLGYLMLVSFFSAAYSLYLFSYIYHGSSFCSDGKIWGPMAKEYVVLFMHFFPLVMLLFNLVLFM